MVVTWGKTLAEKRARRHRWMMAVPVLLLCACFLAACFTSPAPVPHDGISREQFSGLLEDVARAWEGESPESAAEIFTPDALYMQPPDVQLFRGTEQLEKYFGAVEPGTYLRWHHVWFDPASQVGGGEFTFGRVGRETATHGVAVVRVRDSRIARWHEYLQTGPASRDDFLDPEGKTWKWHIGNYP